MDDRPNLILSPHFDDAVLSLGGVIARVPERAVVITVFAGTPTAGISGRWDRRSGFATAAEAMQARSIENDRALAALGVPRSAIHNLDHLDHQYRQRPSGANPDTRLRSAIVEDIRGLIADHQNRINLFAPASSWHPDHRVVTDAVLELWRGGECGDAEIFLYQDQPYAYLDLRSRTLIPLKFANFAVLDDVARKRASEPLEAYFFDLENSDISRKIEAIDLHQSQFRLIRPYLQKMIADFSHYQARKAGRTHRHAEMVYRLLAR